LRARPGGEADATRFHLRAMATPTAIALGDLVVRTILVSRRHLRLLVVLAAEEYVSPEVLAERLGLTLARVEQLLADLQAAGLVDSATVH
jgi:DNA-binding MarR family transcriptional regulator